MKEAVSNVKQILAMLKSLAEGDDEAFFSIALQVAASEARQGRKQTAEEMRAEIDKARALGSRGASIPIQFSHPRGSVEGLLEMRRVLNSFLQFMEEGNSTDSVIICSTNHPSLLDRALLRRYDQILEFEAPSEAQVHNLITSNIAPLKAPHLAWEKIYTAAAGLSQAEIVRAVDDAVKTAILDDKNNLTTEDIVDRLQERHSMRTSSNWELING